MFKFEDTMNDIVNMIEDKEKQIEEEERIAEETKLLEDAAFKSLLKHVQKSVGRFNTGLSSTEYTLSISQLNIQYTINVYIRNDRLCSSDKISFYASNHTGPSVSIQYNDGEWVNEGMSQGIGDVDFDYVLSGFIKKTIND